MDNEFQAEIKRVKSKPKTPGGGSRTARKRVAKPRHSDESEADEQAPLKTVGGTPIIERPPEG
jgi:hypothetical protein